MKSADIRKAFLDFFAQREHKVMPSSPLVLPWDPTVLFTTAGMQQFKPYFEGRSKPPGRRLTSVQKCFRTSDIDKVGDASHLTFFEMLGNFSIGDYFKPEAVAYAWDLVTKTLKLPPERLWATVFLDDDEAFELWRKVGLPAERIRRYGEDDNYWFAGEVGPCGPCSELHFDFGEGHGCGPECEPSHGDCGRFLEVWNLVFMTYLQQEDGSRTPLPAKNIDTGAGLERLAAVALFLDGWKGQRPPSAYDTDLFQPIIKQVEKLSGRKYGQDEATDHAIRIVAEHARAATFLIGDERTPTVPSNEERGYAVRRIIRRAVYFGRHALGIEEPFLAEVAETVIGHMEKAYPEIEKQRQSILDILKAEEERFHATLSRGIDLLEEVLAQHSKNRRKALSSDNVFLLHDTYGFPVELTREIARERGFTIDEAGFQAEMEKQRGRARAAAKGGEAAATAAHAGLDDLESAFVGYETLSRETAVLALLVNGQRVEAAQEGDAVEVILSETPFYPEGGGQVGDRGEIVGPNGRIAVEDTQQAAERLIIHRGRVAQGHIAVGDAVTAGVDERHRQDTVRNHTGTHLLHAALRRVLGTHVRQSGSLVAPDHLRFDFTHTEALSPEQVAQVQGLVNDRIRANLPVAVRNSSFDQAMAEGVLAFFGEAYSQEVRVVEVPENGERFSAELCGGTHCQRTGDIGMLVIVEESSIGAGMRRIEALTGRGAEEYVRRQHEALGDLSRRLGAPPEALADKLAALDTALDAQRRTIARLTQRWAVATASDLMDQGPSVIDGVPLLAAQVDAPSQEGLRQLADAVRSRLKGGVVILGAAIDGKPSFLTVVTPDLTERLHAGELLKRVAAITGGGGGGRPEMAQGGGKDAAKLEKALAQVPALVKEMLSSGAARPKRQTKT